MVWTEPWPYNPPPCISFPPAGRRPPPAFADVLLAGLAPDGGLYLPQAGRSFSAAEIAAFKGTPYQDVAFAILSRFTGGSFSDAELREAIAAAYADFDAPDIAPLVEIGKGRYLLELFHGPTLAFKDIALQVLGQLFARALAKRGGRATIVAATSGDTGSAAIAALGGLPNIDVFVMHPEGPRQRGAAPPDDHQRPCQCPQYRAGRQFRRRPGHREGAVRR